MFIDNFKILIIVEIVDEALRSIILLSLHLCMIEKLHNKHFKKLTNKERNERMNGCTFSHFCAFVHSIHSICYVLFVSTRPNTTTFKIHLSSMK